MAGDKILEELEDLQRDFRESQKEHRTRSCMKVSSQDVAKIIDMLDPLLAKLQSVGDTANAEIISTMIDDYASTPGFAELESETPEEAMERLEAFSRAKK